MRTVHETEALRPSDPVPKHHNAPPSVAGTPAGTPAGKLQRIKLKLSHPPKDEADQYSESANETAGTDDLDEFEIPEFSPELGFDEHEMRMRPQDLYRLLRRQIHWAEKEGLGLRDEWNKIRPKRKQAWLEKEAIFDDVIDAQLRLFTLLMESESAPANATNGVDKSQTQHTGSNGVETDAKQTAVSASPP
jgi:hypothetical protein